VLLAAVRGHRLRPLLAKELFRALLDRQKTHDTLLGLDDATIVLSLAAIAIAVLFYTSFIAGSIRCHRATSQLPRGRPDRGTTTLLGAYARILARHRVQLEVRNSAGAVEDLELLREGRTYRLGMVVQAPRSAAHWALR
jgi:hypothetical protein